MLESNLKRFKNGTDKKCRVLEIAPVKKTGENGFIGTSEQALSVT